MPGFVILLIVVGGIVCAVANGLRGAARQAARQRQQAQEQAARTQRNLLRQRQAAEQQRRDRNQRGRMLQLALMKLDDAPDFRRADSWVEKGADLPASFRQRQFARFRHKLVEHLANRLNAGISTNALMPGLRSLVKHLGVSPFEAEYILQEVEEHHLRRPHHSADEFATVLQRRQ